MKFCIIIYREYVDKLYGGEKSIRQNNLNFSLSSISL